MFVPPRQPTSSSGYNRARGPSPNVSWRSVPVHIRDELHPGLLGILSRRVTVEKDRNGLLTYCAVHHPRAAREMAEKVEEESKRDPLPDGCLASVICELGSNNELLKLLGDRGPDYGLSLLVILELLFQVAFCLRRQKDSTPDVLLAMSYCSRLLEVLSLHLDCPPLWPQFTLKFGMTLTGLTYHRKLQTMAAIRLFQLNYFVFPQTRVRTVFQGKGAAANALKLPEVELMLWRMVKKLSLEPPPAATLKAVRNGRRPKEVQCRIDAMALVFDRLHHLATNLLGAKLYLYGSGATGFATVKSDIDVVLIVSPEEEAQLLNEARHARDTGMVDLNVFPAASQSHSTSIIGDWSWLDDKGDRTAAAIWLNRKFAWACYRLYGWSVQSVQSAYVPIVRVLAAVDNQKYAPCALPPQYFAETEPFSSTISLTQRLAANNVAAAIADSEQDLLNLIAVNGSLKVKHARSLVATSVAAEIVCETMYAHGWEPCLLSEADVTKANAYLKSPRRICSKPVIPRYRAHVEKPDLDGATAAAAGNGNGECVNAEDEEEAPTVEVEVPPSVPPTPAVELTDEEATQGLEDYLMGLFNVYWLYLPQRRAACLDQLHPSSTSAVLLPPRPPESVDDGRLSALGSLERDIYIIEADISVGRQVGIHNSRLLRAYARIDPRVAALGLLVKKWAKTCCIEDSYAGFFSGYQWTLIVIHFLQHYCCAPMPVSYESTREWRALTAAFRHAQCGTHPKFLPLLPNLQNPASAAAANLMRNSIAASCRNAASASGRPAPAAEVPQISAGPLTIKEVEGELNVWFYEPHTGVNELVEDGQHWPENTVLPTSALQYAYTLLLPPFDLDEVIKHVGQHGALPVGHLDQCSAPEIHPLLWTMRLQSCPRPYLDRQDDGETTPVNNSASKALTPHALWDVQRERVKDKMLNSVSSGQNVTSREPFPALTKLRDTTFIEQHVMDRTSSLCESFREQTGPPTLAELVFGFFEYFGTRLNYATDIIDTSRAPELPEGKKEFFRTALFDPEGGAHPPYDTTGREVAGRGNGPYQYRGRHFMCLRDPMEKLRTMGPPYRCQTMITKSLLVAIHRLTEMNAMTEDKLACEAMRDLFTKPMGRLHQPVKPCLYDYLFGNVRHLSSAMTASETQECRAMYNNLRSMILRFGSYRQLQEEVVGLEPVANTSGPRLPPKQQLRHEHPFVAEPQIGTRGTISIDRARRNSEDAKQPKKTANNNNGNYPTPPAPPATSRRHSQGSTATAQPPAPPRKGSTTAAVPKRSPAEAKKGRTKSPEEAPETLKVPEDAAKATYPSSTSSAEAPSEPRPGSSGADEDAPKTSFYTSPLSWCMKASAYRRFQRYQAASQNAPAATDVWRPGATEFGANVEWLEGLTGIALSSKSFKASARPTRPIRAIRARHSATNADHAAEGEG